MLDRFGGSGIDLNTLYEKLPKELNILMQRLPFYTHMEKKGFIELVSYRVSLSWIPKKSPKICYILCVQPQLQRTWKKKSFCIDEKRLRQLLLNSNVIFCKIEFSKRMDTFQILPISFLQFTSKCTRVRNTRHFVSNGGMLASQI